MSEVRPRADRFTSGPWELGRGPKGALAIYRPGPCARELVAGFADRTVTQADAQLMTAAPALLALARQYASECSGCDGTGEVEVHNADGEPAGEAPCADCADIRDVVAKAEGRS